MLICSDPSKFHAITTATCCASHPDTILTASKVVRTNLLWWRPSSKSCSDWDRFDTEFHSFHFSLAIRISLTTTCFRTAGTFPTNLFQRGWIPNNFHSKFVLHDLCVGCSWKPHCLAFFDFFGPQVHQTSQHHPGLRLPGDLCKFHLSHLGQRSRVFLVCHPCWLMSLGGYDMYLYIYILLIYI